MKSLIIAAVGSVVLLSSCSVYRSGQTPDDLYYTPTKEVATRAAGGGGYVAANSGREEGRRFESPGYSAYDDMATMDDRWLMMRVRNRARWSMFDNYGFYSPYNNFYSPYSSWGYSPGLSFGYNFGSPYSYGFYNPYSFNYYNHFNNYWDWNYNYNPYYGNIIVVNPKTNPAGYTRARSFNMNRYNNVNVNRPGRSTFNNGRERYNSSPYGSDNRLQQSNSNRRVFSNRNSDRNDTYRAPSQDRPVRTYTPSTNNNTYSPSRSSGSNSGSSGGSTGGGSGSRPSRR